jgi:proline iminopeptidase
MSSELGYVDIDGKKLYYKVEGQGPPILITTYAGTTAFERLFSSQLRESVQLILLDQGGVEGQSEPRPIKEITMDLFMREIEAVRQVLNLDKLAILGHSACVPIALEYTIRYPSRISHLIMTPNSGPKYDPAYSKEHQTKHWEKYASEERKRILEKNVEDQTKHWEKYASEERKRILEKNVEELGDVSFFDDFGRAYVAYGPRFWFDPYFNSSHIWEGITINGKAVEHVFQNVYEGFDATPYLSEIKCPVLLIGGLYDFSCPPTLWDEYKDDFDDCTYVLFEDSGHNPMYEIPEKFDKLLIDWINTH